MTATVTPLLRDDLSGFSPTEETYWPSREAVMCRHAGFMPAFPKRVRSAGSEMATRRPGRNPIAGDPVDAEAW